MVALKDIELAPDELLHGDNPQLFSTDKNGLRSIEP